MAACLRPLLQRQPLCSAASFGGLARRLKTNISTGLANELAKGDLASGLARGDRGCLARAITLVESSHPASRAKVELLLDSLLVRADQNFKQNGPKALSLRIGLSGPPGAGKSTFIEAFGKHLTSLGRRVAVLAVDPSSVATGGSILGDKTRMPELSVDPRAFIRPSPARGHLGGVTRSTNEAIVLCEAAGYDVIIVETVGVGQSETAVADMVDMFGLVISPAGGDELQGLKKGIVEMCDVVIVNKSDGDLVPAAMRTQAEYLSSLKYTRHRSQHWRVPVLRVSSLQRTGLEQLWRAVEDFRRSMLETEQLVRRRKAQQKAWLHSHLQREAMQALLGAAGVRQELELQEARVEEGLTTPGKAADAVMRRYLECVKRG